MGSFLTGNQHEQKPKKQKIEPISAATPTAAVPISSVEMEEPFGGQGQRPSATVTPKPNLSSPTSFRGDNWSSLPSDSRNKTTDINVSLPGG